MTTAQELSVRDKKELVSKEEQTAPGRHYNMFHIQTSTRPMTRSPW